jgi:hypothetical protein
MGQRRRSPGNRMRRPKTAAGVAEACLALLLLISAPPASALAADPLAAARALYQQGAMTAAATRARDADGPDGLALAARATLVEALYLAPPAAQVTLLERAIADGRAALAQAPDHYDAHLQLAMALGALAEVEGPISAHLKGHAHEGGQLLERARELAPAGDPWPDGLLGIWHLRVVHYGTAPLARELYGASAETGLSLCRRAAAEAPAVLALRYGCAIAMLELDPDGLGDEARAELSAILARSPSDAAERWVQNAARERLEGD